MQVRSSS